MKKVIVIIAGLVLAAGAVNAQSFPKAEIKLTRTNADQVWGKWIDNQGTTVKMRHLSPVAIKEAISETKKLIALINASYDAPFFDESVYYMDKTEEDDLSMFYVNASINFSKITKAWKGMLNGKKYTVMLSSTEDSIGVVYMASE